MDMGEVSADVMYATGCMKPAKELTGPENVDFAMVISSHAS
jgi:hypothetical protein